MQDHHFYDYAVIRVVPKVDREEFMNAGVIVSCPEKDFLDARIELDENRLNVFAPEIDIELLKSHLNAIEAVIAGNEFGGSIGRLSKRERFHWLTSPKSTIIQTSPVHSGYCKDPKETLEHLLKTMVRKK